MEAKGREGKKKGREGMDREGKGGKGWEVKRREGKGNQRIPHMVLTLC